MTHPPLGRMNINIDIPPQLYLFLPPLRTRIFQAPQPGVLTSLLIEQPQMLRIFSILETNLGSQEVNVFLNGIYNIFQ